MTYEEKQKAIIRAKKWIQDVIDYHQDVLNGEEPDDIEKSIFEECEVILDALEKQIKKKPIKKTGAECGMYYKKWNYYCCPTCGEPVQVDDDELYSTIYYPTCECGQKIKYDWECDEE